MAESFETSTVPPEKKKLPVWAIILIIVGVILLCLCLLIFVLPLLGLTLLGPEMGDIMSQVQQTIEATMQP